MIRIEPNHAEIDSTCALRPWALRFNWAGAKLLSQAPSRRSGAGLEKPSPRQIIGRPQ
jgi:hypothetical protein